MTAVVHTLSYPEIMNKLEENYKFHNQTILQNNSKEPAKKHIGRMNSDRYY
jgi:hypothetical protein